MKISNLIFVKYDFEIMQITDSNDENPLNWSLLSIDENLIPNEGHFLVRSKQIKEDKEWTCWMNISAPEMICDFVFTIDAQNSKIVLNDYHSLSEYVVPNKLSDNFCSYELYYTNKNPEVGLNILKNQINNVSDKAIICEYIGYIYRDENNQNEAIKWFMKGLELGQPSSEYIYLELSELYKHIGDLSKANEYNLKYEQINSGI